MLDKKNCDNVVCFFYLKIYIEIEIFKFELFMVVCIYMLIIVFYWVVCSCDVF